MHREDNSNFLLYVEPPADKKSAVPVNDELVTTLRLAIENSVSGTSSYSSIDSPVTFCKGAGFRGMHTADDGTMSDNKDYLLPNGMITNSLAVHYMMWYRDWIPETEIKKVKELCTYYGRKFND